MRKLEEESVLITSGSIHPLFPLPNVYLFPGTLLPLHIFEPRYRQLVSDLLDGSGNIVIGTLAESETPPGVPRGTEVGDPPILSLAGIGRLENYHAFPDGRFVVVILGLARVEVQEAESDRLYRRVTVEVLEEVPEPPEETESLRDQLRAAIADRAGQPLALPDEMPVGQLADLLLMYLKLPSLKMEQLYGCLEVAHRARAALNAYEEKRD